MKSRAFIIKGKDKTKKYFLIVGNYYCMTFYWQGGIHKSYQELGPSIKQALLSCKKAGIKILWEGWEKEINDDLLKKIILRDSL